MVRENGVLRPGRRTLRLVAVSPSVPDKPETDDRPLSDRFSGKNLVVSKNVRNFAGGM